MALFADQNRRVKFVPFMLLSILLWSAGGLILALVMMPDFANGSTFRPFEEVERLKSFAQAVGKQTAFTLILITVSAGAGVAVGWRIYRSLAAAQVNQKL